jgi:DNA-damage-inducible protein J
VYLFFYQKPALRQEQAEFDAELEKGYADFVQENTKSANKAFSDIRRDYEI